AVLAESSSVPGIDEQRGRRDCRSCVAARRRRHRRRAPPASHRGDADAPSGRLAHRDRAGAPAPSCEYLGDLREGGSRPLARRRPTVAGRCSMSTLRRGLVDYLATRRALGFKLTRDGKLLPGFIDYLEQSGNEFLSSRLAVAWA